MLPAGPGPAWDGASAPRYAQLASPSLAGPGARDAAVGLTEEGAPAAKRRSVGVWERVAGILAAGLVTAWVGASWASRWAASSRDVRANTAEVQQLQAASDARPEWKVVRGDAQTFPQLQLNLGSGFAPFQLRGFDYSPITPCCGNNDASVFQRASYERDIPRMAAMGANAIKLYGMCDGVLDGANYCGPPEAGCQRDPVTVSDVIAFLDFCWANKMFVLLANRADRPGALEAYQHIVEAYGAHPAVAGAIIFDETLDLQIFNQVAQVLHDGFCRVFGKDPATTPVEEVGKIITTAAQGQIPQKEFQQTYGANVNSWGFDPYSEWQEEPGFLVSYVPFKPYIIMENGLNGAGNAGCRDDCASACDCMNLQACACTPCTCLSAKWKEYVAWMRTARLNGIFIFEWTDEYWKGGVHVVGGNVADGNGMCLETKEKQGGEPGFDEANHGIFRVTPDNQLVSKSLGNGETLDSVLSASWAAEPAGELGFRGWQRPVVYQRRK